LEDKEKAPQIKSPTETPGLEKKKSNKADENVEITAEELNEVKNLPDIVKPQKEVEKNKERRASTKEKSEPLEEGNLSLEVWVSLTIFEEVKIKYEKKNPPSYQRPVAAEIAKNKEVVIENVKIDYSKSLYSQFKQEEKENNDDTIRNKTSQAAIQKIEARGNFKDEGAWKVANEERNLKVVKLGENQRGLPNEELKQGEYYIAEDEDQEDAEVDQANEEENSDEEEEENIESTAPSDKELEVDRSVLIKKLEKGLKKKKKIQHLIEDIKSNKYIKALGDKVFEDIINFFKIKLEVCFGQSH